MTPQVKQDDPLSLIIFNLVIDQLVRSLPQECGSTYNGKTVRTMAFADDLILLADSPIGLQHLLDWTSTFLWTCGLLNTSKCHTVLIVGNGGLRKTVVDANRIFHIKGKPLRALSREDSWKYLGIEFSPEERRPVRLNNQLSPLLERLTKAPLKPQQRIFALKAGALPNVYYHMALGRINISDIRKADKMVRAFVRQRMALPNDSSIGYFHAPVSEGGLGIPSLRWLAPLHRKDRLLGLVAGRRIENITDPYLAKE